MDGFLAVDIESCRDVQLFVCLYEWSGPLYQNAAYYLH